MKLSVLLKTTAVALVLSATMAHADVKFGALYPLSGPLALLGEESARGLEIAVDEINAAGGVQGQKIVLVKGDAVDNNQAIGEARRLISLERVSAIFGSYSSARSIAASQVAEMSGIPYFEMGAVADEVTGRGLKYLFRANPFAGHMGQTAVRMIVDKIAPGLGKKPGDLKIGIIYEDSSYGTSVAKHQIAYAKEAGLNIVFSSGYPGNTVDMSSLVLQLKQAGVDVLLQTSYQNDSVLFLQQASEAGFKPSALIGGGGGYSMQPTADAVGHDVIENVLDVDFTQYTVNTKATPGLEEFVAAYKKKYGSEPRSGHSLNNYASSKAILEAISKAKSFDPDELVEVVKTIDVADETTAAGYGIKFGDANQNERAQMMGMQWRGGKLLTVYPDAFAATEMRFEK